MTRVRLSRIFWIGAAAILVAAALVALVAVVRGDFSDTDGRILLTLAVLLYTGGGLLAGLTLVERRTAAWLGWALAVGSPLALAAMLPAIWEWVGNGDSDELWELAWSASVAMAAGLIASTSLLLARGALVRVAWGAGALATAAAALSIAAIWSSDPGDNIGKLIAALWILAALAYFLVPVLQRFTSAGADPRAVRVVAELDGVEVVAARGPVEGVRIEAPAAGERLVLRRKA